MALQPRGRVDTVFGTAGDDTLTPPRTTRPFQRPVDLFGLAGNDILTGTFLADSMNGGSGNDVLNGTNGGIDFDSDTLVGGSGDDTITGGNGDLINGGVGVDFARVGVYPFDPSVFAGGAFVPITSSGTLGDGGVLRLSTGVRLVGIERLDLLLSGGGDSVSTGASEDTIRGAGGNDVLATLGGNDALFGDLGDDRLDGGDGADRLLGGSGLDSLIGGAGADVFVLDQFGSGDGVNVFNPGLDRILDFNVAEGDRYDASYVAFFGDGGSETAFLDDPFAAGFARITDTAEGALVEWIVSRGEFDPRAGGLFVQGTLFVGVTVAELGTDFLV